MYNLICVESGLPYTDESGLAVIYDTGRIAASVMEILHTTTGKRYRPAKIIDPNWKAREQAKFNNGEYLKPCWLDYYYHAYEKTDRYTGNKSLAYVFTTYDVPLDRPTNYAGDTITQKNIRIPINPDHFLHVSKLDSSKIAYTKDAESGTDDRQTQTTVGRYLTAYCDNMDNELIKYINALHQQEYQPVNVLFATGEKITDVYKACHDTGASSCMTKPNHYYESSEHPTMVYSAGDLSLAYIADANENIKARALVWQEKKIYARLYGDYESLRSGLQTLGYSSDGNMHGAKIKRINHETDSDRLVLPYLDGIQTVSIIDDNWLMIDRNGDIDANTTDGLQRNPHWATCDRCEDDIESEEDAYTVYSRRYSCDTWCEHCRDNDSFWCEGTQEYVRNDRAVTVDGETYSEWHVIDNANLCQFSGEYTFTDTTSVYVSETDIEQWSDDILDDESFICRITGNRYSNDLMATDDWIDQPRAEFNEPDDQPMPAMITCARPYQSGFACAA